MLVISTQLPGLGSGTAFAIDDYNASGVSNTEHRILTIWAKDSTPIAASAAQESFYTDTDADNLANLAEAREFKITKITPAVTDLSKVIPGNLATYTAGVVAYVQTEGARAIIDFSSPKDLGPGGSGHVSMTTGKASDSGLQDSYAPDNGNILDRFVDPPGQVGSEGATADGVYLVEDHGDSGWWAVVEIPTFTKSEATSAPTGINASTNYHPVLYAKVAEALKPEFNSYVNIISKAASSAPETTNRFEDRSIWEADGVTKSEKQMFSAAVTLNGIADEYDYLGSGANNKLGQIAFGFAYTDATATVDSMAMQGSGTNAGSKIPYLTFGNKNTNKTLTRVTDTSIDLGILLTKTDDPTQKRYVRVDDIYSYPTTSAPYAFGNTSPLYGAYCYAGSGNNNNVAFNQTDGFVFATGASGLDPFMPPQPGTTRAVWNFTEAVAYALLPVGTPLIDDQTNAGNLRRFSIGPETLIEFNDPSWTSIADIFARDSSLRIELVISIPMTLAGSSFVAGNTAATNIKPFLYGTTLNPAKGIRIDDLSTFVPAAVSGTSAPTLSQLGTAQYGMYAYAYTGALNAVKTDQAGATLSGAQFLLMKREGGNNYYCNSTSTPASGPVWLAAGVAPNANAANCLKVTSDANGKVSFDGLDPDGNSPTQGKYYLVEYAAPTGYKDLEHNTVEGVSDYGGALVQAVTLGFDANLAADAKGTGDPDYVMLTKVINVPKLALPNTGGPGLVGLIALGVALLCMAVLIRYKTRRSALPAHSNRKGR
jgi:hypothetical protein